MRRGDAVHRTKFQINVFASHMPGVRRGPYNEGGIGRGLLEM